MGIFSSDYESAGVGIPKNAPKKKGIMRFFELYFRKFWKLMQVNLLYTVFFIPLFMAVYALFKIENRTVAQAMILFCVVVFACVVGPATAGMMKIIRNYTLEKHAFILTDFKKAFSENYSKSLVMGLIDILAAVSVSAAIYVYPKLAKVYGNAIFVLLAISVSVMLMIVMMNFYAFLMITATDLSFKNILKNSFALAFIVLKKNFLTLLIILVISGVFVLLTILNLSTLLLLPFVPASTIAFIVCFNSYPVIQKYVINPYYERNGEVNPELDESDSDDEVLFEDKGGSEKPVEKEKNKGRGNKAGKKASKGKIIS